MINDLNLDTLKPQPFYYDLLASEHFILIAFVCSLLVHSGFAIFNFDFLKASPEKPKPITVKLVKKPAPPIVKPPTPIKPQKKIVKKIKPKPKKKKRIKKKVKRKPIVKPVPVPMPESPVKIAVPEPEPLPIIAPTPEVEVEPLPEIEPPKETIEPPPVVEPPPAIPAGPTPDEIANAKANYISLLQKAMARHKKYPRIAKSRGWQGKVVIQFKIDNQGNILSKSVLQSSGHNVLDKAALKMAAKAAPFPVPPKALQDKELSVNVPIPFKLVSGN